MLGTVTAWARHVHLSEAYEGRDDMAPELRGFYAFHQCLMEAWDGPAAVEFDSAGVGDWHEDARKEVKSCSPSRYDAASRTLEVDDAARAGIRSPPIDSV